ncbi:MAG: RNA polymerase sigma factor [Planctomycetota bacterium]
MSQPDASVPDVSVPDVSVDVSAWFGPEMRQRLIGFAHRFVGDSWEAEDVAQETLLRAASQLSALRSAERGEAWLFRICRHAAIDHVRSRRVRSGVWSPLTEEVADGVRESGPREPNRAVDLRELPAHQRVLLSLHYERGLSQPTLCLMSGLNAAALRVRLFRARGALLRRSRRLARAG